MTETVKEKRRWSRYVEWGLVAIAFLGPILLTLWNFRHDVQVDRELRRSGVVVDGEVVERRTPTGRGSLRPSRASCRIRCPTRTTGG